MDNARSLASRLLDLLRREQSAMADFLLALGDFDRKRLWQDLGHTSLFTFLHRELGLSKGASHFRKVASELVQRYPEVVEPLRDGRLCITSVVELAKVITPQNRAEVLPRFFHTSKKEAKEVSAELRPQDAAPHRLVVTALKPGSSPCATALAEPRRDAPSLPIYPPSPSAVPPVRPDEPRHAELPMAAPTQAAPSKVEPLTANLRRLHVTVSTRFMEKLEVARSALSHSHRGADAEAILEAGLDLLIERAAKRRGIVAKPRRQPPSPLSSPPVLRPEGEDGASRAIPAAVKREVWIRDEGRCRWRLENGEVCGSTHRLQFDHVRPVARGGGSTVENIRILCAGHNLLAARRAFGDALMDRYAPVPSSGRERSTGAADPVTGIAAQRGAVAAQAGRLLQR
jgi:hypothetical protein